MKFYSVPFAVMAVLFHGSDYVYGNGSKLGMDTMADTDAHADHRSLRPQSNKKCLDRCSERFAKCKKDCPSTQPPPTTTTTQVHSRGEFQIRSIFDLKLHDRGVKTVGSACNLGCKRHSFSAHSENESFLACGGQLDTKRARWASNDVTDCRVRIQYCKHHLHLYSDSAPCKWEIKETCSWLA